MTLEQFMAKYGTEGASLLLDRAAESLKSYEQSADEGECAFGPPAGLAGKVAEIAQDLKSVLNTSRGTP